MHAPEAERLVEGLRAFDPQDIGNAEWMQQHTDIEKLNVQAQMSIVSNSDEFVAEAILTFEKFDVLVHELLVCEAWKEQVFDDLVKILASKNNVKTYFVLYHEALIISLLEKVMYHSSCMDAPAEALLELADYCYRRTLLLTRGDLHERIEEKDDGAEESGVESLMRQKHTIDFGVAMSALTIVRFMAEYSDSAPLSVLARLVDEQDILCTLVPILDSAPWMRRIKGKVSKFSDGKWYPVEGDEVHRLSKTEAQVWLAVYHLILAPAPKKKYSWTEFKKGNAMRARKHLTEVLIDQLPVLSDLARFLDQLQIASMPEAPPQALLISQVPEVRETLIKRTDWKLVRKETLRNIAHASEADKRKELQRLAAVYGANNFEEFMDDPKCGVCGKTAEKRCSRCKIEWYCSRECQVGAWKKHKPFCDAMLAANKQTAEN